jgi:hypothetical protein
LLPNGNIVYTGGRPDTGPILHSYSPDGTHQWSRSYNTFGAIYYGTGSKNLLVMPDGSILFCMYHNDYVLIKTDSEGYVVANDDPIHTPSAISSSHYPNPASDQITIDYKAENRGSILTLEVFNIRGQMLYSCPLTGSEGSHQLSLLQDTDSRWAPGVYMYRVKDEHSGTSISKRFVITK